MAPKPSSWYQKLIIQIITGKASKLIYLCSYLNLFSGFFHHGLRTFKENLIIFKKLIINSDFQHSLTLQKMTHQHTGFAIQKIIIGSVANLCQKRVNGNQIEFTKSSKAQEKAKKNFKSLKVWFSIMIFSFKISRSSRRFLWERNFISYYGHYRAKYTGEFSISGFVVVNLKNSIFIITENFRSENHSWFYFMTA